MKRAPTSDANFAIFKKLIESCRVFHFDFQLLSLNILKLFQTLKSKELKIKFIGGECAHYVEKKQMSLPVLFLFLTISAVKMHTLPTSTAQKGLGGLGVPKPDFLL